MDGYDYDGDDGFGFEDNWLYVEDEFALADELAETQIAEPGYPGTNYEIDLETYEYEMYEFWDDMEYADDEYWDYGVRSVAEQDSGQIAQKRKRSAQHKIAHPDKKRKLIRGQAPIRKTETEGNFPICYMSMKEQLRVAERRPPVLQSRRAVAFLADWRERFPASDDIMVVDMPEDMQRAAEAEDENTALGESLAPGHSKLQEGNVEEWVEEEETDGQDGGALPSLDLETLKTVLRQKMAEAGLEGVGEEELMSTISQMLNGDGDSDEAAGDLASVLLGKAKQGGETAFTGWLSQQGVSLEDGEDDDTSVASEDRQRLPANSNGDVSHGADAHSTSSIPGNSLPRTGRLSKTVKKVELSIPLNNDEVAEGVDDVDSTRSVSELTTNAPRGGSTRSRSTSKKQVIEQPESTDQKSKPPATKTTRKRKAPANEALEVETDTGTPRAIKEPATKRTRSSRAR